jgi:hypothetical protein
LTYILKNDTNKRNAIEMNTAPTRLYNARKKRGHNNFKNLAKEIESIAIDKTLTGSGLTREMTQERRDGTLKIPSKQEM